MEPVLPKRLLHTVAPVHAPATAQSTPPLDELEPLLELELEEPPPLEEPEAPEELAPPELLPPEELAAAASAAPGLPLDELEELPSSPAFDESLPHAARRQPSKEAPNDTRCKFMAEP